MTDYTEDEQKLIWGLSKYPVAYYRLLGYLLNYYGGTFNPNKDIITRMFVFDNLVRLKGDKDNHLELERLCIEFFRETGLINDLTIDKERCDFEKYTKYIFISKNICNYVIQTDYQNTINLFITLFKPPYGSYPTALLQRLEFIVGAYLFHRSENEGEWIFFNNYKKVLMIHNFMTALAEENDIIQIISRFLTPNVHKIKLNTDGLLWNKINERFLRI